MAEVIKNRYEFTILFDVENGNPNGDRMQATCHVLILKLVMALLLMFA